MRKNIIYCLLLLGLLTAASCQEDTNTASSDIRVGTEDLQEVSINKQSTRMILLTGGNGKYTANIADSKIAGIEISKDTLRIKGLFEGQTYATIISGDFKRRIQINIVPPELSISQSEVQLYPRDESKFISLRGGGDIVDLKIDDPQKIMDVKWDAKTNIIEILAFYEGEATITAISQNKTTQSLKVVVKCSNTAERVGIYSTTSRSLSPKMNTVMAIRRPNVGVWLSGGARPYSSKKVLKITPAIVNPQVGTNITVTFEMSDPDEFKNGDLKEGKYQLYIEEVREKNVVLRGRGIKLVIPYEKK